MSKKNPCIFCGKRSSARHHKEDVLPKWIAREFPGTWRTVFGQSGKTFAKRGEIGIVSRLPCTECNNGWMSRLESAAKPVLIPLMKGVASDLAPEQQKIISAWLLKTCIMVEVLHDTNPDYFEAGDRKALKESLAIPAQTSVFLARYVGAHEIRIHEMPLDLAFGPLESAAWSYSYSATLAIKQLAFQIFSFRTPENHSLTVTPEIPRFWHDATIQIWPTGNSVRWPPPFALDDKAFDFFANRWANLR
jgi:hypothetical protein